MTELFRGEDQNVQVKIEGDVTMQNEIQKLMAEVEHYKQAIQDAKDALASAEIELDDVLQEEYENQ